MSKEQEYKMMTEQLRLTNSNEKVADYLRWIITSDTAKEYWEEYATIKSKEKDIEIEMAHIVVDNLLKENAALQKQCDELREAATEIVKWYNEEYEGSHKSMEDWNNAYHRLEQLIKSGHGE